MIEKWWCVIHEPYTAKIPHLYSGCQVFGGFFHPPRQTFFSWRRVEISRRRILTHSVTQSDSAYLSKRKRRWKCYDVCKHILKYKYNDIRVLFFL